MTVPASNPDAHSAADPSNPDPLVARELADRPVADHIMAAADGQWPLPAAEHAGPAAKQTSAAQLQTQIAAQHQLKNWVARSLADDAAPSAALRDSIRDLMVRDDPRQMRSAGAADGATHAIAGPSWWWRWSPALAAGLLLLLTLGIQFQIATQQATGDGGAWVELGVENPPDWLSVASFNQFGRRHVLCSRGVEAPYNREQFIEDGKISIDRISSFLGTQVPAESIDLIPLGFEPADAGFCPLPGKKATHLIYQPIRHSPTTDTLSLWITPADDQWRSRLTEGRPLLIDGPMVPHPMAVWRRADLVFFLVSDSSQSSQAAVNLITNQQPRL